MLHPFTPFVTEALWRRLKAAATDFSPDFAPAQGWEESLIIAKWPETGTVFPDPDEAAIAGLTLVQEIIRAIRNIRTEKNVKAGQKLPALIAAGEDRALFEEMRVVLAALASLDAGALTIVDRSDEAAPEGTLSRSSSSKTVSAGTLIRTKTL